MTLTTKSKIYRLLSLCMAGILFPMQSGWADQTNSTQQRGKERWFEIEVILYKSTSEAGLNNESWPRDTQLKIPTQVIDFLHPFNKPKPFTNKKNDFIAQNLTTDAQSKTHEPNTSAFDASEQGNLDPEHSGSNRSDQEHSNQLAPVNKTLKGLDPSTRLEKPFLPLNKKNLQLTGEANRISRNSHYTLVAHFSWRQPVFSQRNSPAVRIAGGFDYQETFEYSGSKKVDPAYLGRQVTSEPQLTQEYPQTESSKRNPEQFKNYIEPPTSSGSRQNANNETPSNTGLVALETALSSAEQNQSEANLQAEIKFVPVPTPLPWVPEIDGSMRVYIQRNYLRIDANIFYRLPFKENVSALDLTSTVISFEGGLPNFASSDENTAKFMPQNTFVDTGKTDQISRQTWRLDDGFLARKTKKPRITRLFNYPLKQTRRLRSGELHYFDHPLIGMLVMIRPYQRGFQANIEGSENASLNQKDLDLSLGDADSRKSSLNNSEQHGREPKRLSPKSKTNTIDTLTKSNL